MLLPKSNQELDLHVSRVELKVTSIYKLLYQLNDLILGLVFLTGSFMFSVTIQCLPGPFCL